MLQYKLPRTVCTYLLHSTAGESKISSIRADFGTWNFSNLLNMRIHLLVEFCAFSLGIQSLQESTLLCNTYDVARYTTGWGPKMDGGNVETLL